jgi:hypothetical protein
MDPPTIADIEVAMNEDKYSETIASLCGGGVW